MIFHELFSQGRKNLLQLNLESIYHLNLVSPTSVRNCYIGICNKFFDRLSSWIGRVGEIFPNFHLPIHNLGEIQPFHHKEDAFTVSDQESLGLAASSSQ